MLRYLSGCVAIVLALSPMANAADSFSGKWRASMAFNGMNCQLDLAMSPAKTYTEAIHCGPYVTSQDGVYTVSKGVLGFDVRRWSPTRQWIVEPSAGAGHWEPTGKPPGGSYKYAFPTPNALSLHDINTGADITFHRVQ